MNLLQTYKTNRNSDTWRISRHAEQLCEYALYLEGFCAIQDDILNLIVRERNKWNINYQIGCKPVSKLLSDIRIGENTSNSELARLCKYILFLGG